MYYEYVEAQALTSHLQARTRSLSNSAEGEAEDSNIDSGVK